ncbi:uncharacterized protein LOC124269730 isoform X1 [Haliotis rubra]|uniref:uncharacterized protein LOC124269730 isoform X1 n=1 Tax=Haliotis rubra TaxID=36100 RepID=UPI001EE52A14|nr:uncharacterized protein LOC124269730 isoform X1 [Haliotis rubra]
MELQSFVTVQIQTFDPNANLVKLSVPSEQDEVSVHTLHSKVCEHLGLKKSSWKHFCLCQGFDKPVKRYKASEMLLVPVKDLSLQKWCFNPADERRMLKTDSQAVHLLNLQAQYQLSEGILQPTEAEKLKLEECLEPTFVMEEQYVSLCQQLPNYYTTCVRNCQLCHTLQLPTSTPAWPRNSLLSVFVSKHGLKVVSDNSEELIISWYEVVQWAWHEGERTLTYTVQLQECSPLVELRLMTIQAEYLLSATMEGVFSLMADDDDAPTFHASMISMQADGSKQWSNCLFEPAKAAESKRQM